MTKATTLARVTFVCGLLGCSASTDTGGREGEIKKASVPIEDEKPPVEDGEKPSFENPTQPGMAPPPPPPPAPKEEKMPMAGAGEECEAGKFCVNGGPDGGCGQITFEAETEVTRHPGNLLLVFDRSGSMASDWQGQARWQAAGEAIADALGQISADVALAGAVFFPTPPEPFVCESMDEFTCAVEGLAQPEICGVDAANAASRIDFVSGDEFLASFTMMGSGTPPGLEPGSIAINAPNPDLMITGEEPPYFPVPNGRTPLMEALQQADQELANASLDGVTAVVVITDGEPNCEWDAAVANQIVTDWRMNLGISTHVIGLPGASGMFGGGGGRGPDGAQVLNELAAAAGTDQFITPADPDTLKAQLQSIVYETVSMGFNSCNIDLKPAAVVPEKLLMIVHEPGVAQKQQVPRDFGWELNKGGNKVTMTGKLCDEAKGGRFTSITFEYACPESPPPPPIPPLQ